MELQPGITIGVLTCGQPDHTLRCMASLVAQSTDLPVRLVILDNGLANGDGDRLYTAAQRLGFDWLVGDDPNRAVLPRLGIVRRNDIWRATNTVYAGFLDNDVTWDPSCVRVGIAYLEEHTRVAQVGFQLLRPDGRIDCAGLRVPPGECRGEHLGFGQLPGPPWHRVMRVPWLGNGISRTEALHAAGLFDERCAPMGCEDLLLGCRLRALGHEIHLLPHPTVVHDAHQTMRGMRIDWPAKFAMVRAEFGWQEEAGEWESEVVDG